MNDPNKPLISKDQFVEVINFIHDQDGKFADLVSHMEALTPGFYCDFFPNYEYNSRLITLLNILLKETDEYSLIDYFFYETEFGANKEHTIISAAGKEFDISTPEKLYDAIVEINFTSQQHDSSDNAKEVNK